MKVLTQNQQRSDPDDEKGANGQASRAPKEIMVSY